MTVETLLDLDDSNYAVTVERDDDDVVTITALVGLPRQPEMFVRVTVSRAALLAALGTEA